MVEEERYFETRQGIAAVVKTAVVKTAVVKNRGGRTPVR
jgi:hypothetical protein